MSGSQFAAVFRALKMTPSEAGEEDRNQITAWALASEVDANTAVNYLKSRDSRFAEVSEVLREGGIQDAEILAFYRATVSPGDDRERMETIARRLPDHLLQRLESTQTETGSKRRTHDHP